MKLLSKILHHPVIASAIGAVVGLVFAGQKVAGVSTLWSFITSLPSIFSSPVSIPLYSFLVLFLISLFTLILFIILVVLQPDKTAEWENYTEDKFFGVIWRWRYGSYGITALKQFCPNPECDMELLVSEKPVRGSSYSVCRYICPRCGSVGNSSIGSKRFSEDYLKKEIERKCRLISKGKSIEDVLEKEEESN